MVLNPNLTFRFVICSHAVEVFSPGQTLRTTAGGEPVHWSGAQRPTFCLGVRVNLEQKISNEMDNDTMVETFKFFNYCQLAKNSLVSKKYRDLIQIHRHKLALFYVDTLVLSNFHTSPSLIIVFDEQLLPENYNEWVIRNGYSKQIPIEGQVVGKQSAHNSDRVYVLRANAGYNGSTIVFYTQTSLNHNHWPLFQHFVRLLMDPFVHIRHVDMIPQNDVLNLLTGAFNQDRNRLECKTIKLNFEGNVQKLTGWIKRHVRCNEIQIHNDGASGYEEELIDLLMTGAHCTSAIKIEYSIPLRIIVELVQKFINLKRSDGCQVIESIRDNVTRRSGDVLNYAEFAEITKEEINEDINEDGSTVRVLEFVNSDVGKTLQIIENIFRIDDIMWYNCTSNSFVITIKNL
ncbi:hypothetical protein Ddc_13075 [Ditylenchus destructor]|nr:hypothetical protein Ddc_13075 [Ditylenchus destructor]